MRFILPLIACLSLASLSTAATKTKLILDAETAIELPSSKLDRDQQTLAKQIVAALKSEHPLPKNLPLVNPPEWGKTINASTKGRVDYFGSFEDVFLCHLSLRDLDPNRTYRLTLNGKPGLAGNELLPTPVPGLPNEFFYDFMDIESDENGSYDETLAIKLRPGEYDVRIYVKDTSDWKIVLYRDYFEFNVE